MEASVGPHSADTCAPEADWDEPGLTPEGLNLFVRSGRMRQTSQGRSNDMKIVSLPAVVVLALAAVPAAAQDEDWWWHDDWGHMASGGLFMVIFWGGLIVLAVVLVRYLVRSDRTGPPPAAGSTPHDILAERFARGEIDKEEYEERRSVLSGNTR